MVFVLSLAAIDYESEKAGVSYGRGKLQVAISVEMKPKRLSAAFMLRALLMFYLLAGVFYSRFQHSVYDHLRVSLVCCLAAEKSYYLQSFSDPLCLTPPFDF